MFAALNNYTMIHSPIKLEIKKAADRIYNSQLEAFREQSNIGGLNKSHKAQRLANSIEAVYFQNALICFKSDRAENQRNERRSKR